MRDAGKAIVIITHKMHEVLSISDRVAVLRKGEHAAFSAVIWKCAKSKRAKAIEEETGEKQPASMFMKKAYFFTASQVDALATA